MKVFAISGWKQNGKDTVAEYLIEKYGAKRVSFADPLKDMAAKEYDIPREAFDRPELKEQPILHLPVNPQDGFSRNLSEFLVKEFRSTQGVQPEHFTYINGEFYGQVRDKEDSEGKAGLINVRVYWTPRALAILKGSSNRTVRSDFWVAQAIDLAKSKGGIVVISDLRYQSELAQMRSAFGDSLETLRVQRHDTSPSKDPSERDLDEAKFDFFLDNRGTLQDLYDKVDGLAAHLRIK